MSELSMDELQAETGELLPERETLGTITLTQVGTASASQTNSAFFGAAAGNSNSAVLVQSMHVTNGSFNSHHTFFTFI
jgi:hypothetical protein